MLRTVFLLVALSIVVIPAGASADPTVTMRIKGGAAFGGSLDSQRRSVADDVDLSTEDPVVQDLEASFGGTFGVEIAPIPWFSTGIQYGVTSWATTLSSDLDLGRDIFMDFDGVLRGLWPVIDELTLFVAVPIGLTVNRFSRRNQEAAGSDWDHGVGWNVGASLGLEWHFGNGGGLSLQGGWVRRDFTHSTNGGSLFGTPVDLKLDGVINQATVEFGFLYEL